MARRKLHGLAVVLALLAATMPFGCAGESGPDPSDTDIWIVDLLNQGGLLAVGRPEQLTDRDGYDNQPAFLEDGEGLLWASASGSRVDPWWMLLCDDEAERLALTLESEYSPQPIPGSPDISVVRVEQDGRQRLWSRPLGDDAPPRLLLPAPDHIGYYAWIDRGAIALHVLGAEPTLAIAEAPDWTPRVVRRGIGRSLQSVPGRRAVSYGVFHDAATEWIHIYTIDDDRDEALAPALPGSADHAWTPDGLLLMARESIVWALDPATSEWNVFADFTGQGPESITRLAVSPAGDRIALVAAD